MLDEHAVDCPYCGEPITLLVDGTEADQRYVEDCSVCCRPIEVRLSIDPAGDFKLTLSRDDDV
jgi:Cysteine-rich CPXCG